MATNDVPGARPANRDKLAPGCWGEHEDGSLILVNAVEGESVVYSLYGEAAQWPGSMPAKDFKENFSWPKSGERWTWHDKTPFPWDRVTKRQSVSLPFDDEVGAAARVARDLGLRAQRIMETAAPRIKREITDMGRALMGKLPE